MSDLGNADGDSSVRLRTNYLTAGLLLYVRWESAPESYYLKSSVRNKTSMVKRSQKSQIAV